MVLFFGCVFIGEFLKHCSTLYNIIDAGAATGLLIIELHENHWMLRLSI